MMKTMEPPSPNQPVPLKAKSCSASTTEAKALDCIQRSVTEDQICILTFDRPQSQANLFDRATLMELDEHLRIVDADPRLKGLVLCSAKPNIFIAGADIKTFAEDATPDAVGDLVDLGQSTFNRLATLSIPTVAAIHGACVGGGYEICLACDYRIASPDSSTRIGLPETLLGILPGWGGSTRLPRLIGLPGSLDVILAGKTLPAKLARKRGLVDDLAPSQSLVTEARRLLLRKGSSLKHRGASLKMRLLNSRPAASLIRHVVRRQLLQKTRGQYPAVLEALDVVTRGVGRPLPQSLHLERRALVKLFQTDVCRNLIQLFLLQERAKKLGSDRENSSQPTREIAVIGAGVMGAGIAQWASSKKLRVILRDINREQVSRGMATIGKLYDQACKRRILTPVERQAGLDRVIPAAEEVPMPRVDLVIEAAVERMDLKRQIFERLGAQTGSHTILATNTSALSISEIASSTRHPERVVGIHFFNPVHRMQLVEVVQGRHTSPQVLDRAVQFVRQIGKLPVVVQDSPGFLVNRILVPYLIEAGSLFERGARIEDIDATMLDFGMPMGPLRLIDEVGVDVAKHVAQTLADHFPGHIRVPRVLDRLMEVGQLGRKTGHGFYRHSSSGKACAPHAGIERFQEPETASKLDRSELRRRMVLRMINEAARCLEENVVRDPADVDFAMVMGTGFAPFRGGPLCYADSLGIPNIARDMEQLATAEGGDFAPCDFLARMARNGETFYAPKGTGS